MRRRPPVPLSRRDAVLVRLLPLLAALSALLTRLRLTVRHVRLDVSDSLRRVQPESLLSDSVVLLTGPDPPVLIHHSLAPSALQPRNLLPVIRLSLRQLPLS